MPRGWPLGGTLIAISERGRDKDGNHPRVPDRRAAPGRVHDQAQGRLRRQRLPPSLPRRRPPLLERKFGWTTGLDIRIRRIPLAAIAPGALVDGPGCSKPISATRSTTWKASVCTAGRRRPVLTLISDDNFSMLQRTIAAAVFAGEGNEARETNRATDRQAGSVAGLCCGRRRTTVKIAIARLQAAFAVNINIIHRSPRTNSP